MISTVYKAQRQQATVLALYPEISVTQTCQNTTQHNHKKAKIIQNNPTLTTLFLD